MPITNTPEIEKKLTEYKNHCFDALRFFYDNDYGHCTADFRKSCEAIFKIMIFANYGDSDGLKIVMGEIKEDGSSSDNRELQFNKLLQVSRNTSFYNNKLTSAFKTIQKYGNANSHNPNTTEETKKPEAELCKGHSYEITKWIYNELNLPIPEDLEKAHEGESIPEKIESTLSDEWCNFYSAVDEFPDDHRYVLIAPPLFTNCSDEEIKSLTKINWSLVIDFNPNSKVNGLYSLFAATNEYNLTPISIEQLGQNDLISQGKFKINWFFASGLSDLPDTIPQNYTGWRTKKYHNLLKSIIKELLTKTLSRTTFIYLWDDITYLRNITEIISEANEDANDLNKHVYISNVQDRVGRIEELEAYGDIDIIELDYNSLFMGISSSIEGKGEVLDNTAKYVPVWNDSNQHTYQDISFLYPTLLDNHIEVVHRGIAEEFDFELPDIPNFYKGEKITWYELSNDIDVKRTKTESIYESVKSLLNTSKFSIRFDIKHSPGAGGTTIGRRLAYDLRILFPSIVITHYDRNQTYKCIRQLADFVRKPILAIVEASQININEIDELIKKCNTDKKVVIFVYIQRAYGKITDKHLISGVRDTMQDISEKNKFINNVNHYITDKTKLDTYKSKRPSDCDVLEFSLLIDEKEYSSLQLIEYIKGYTNKMEDKYNLFATYSSLIYYYTQKDVSELTFRKMFKKSLFEDLKHISKSEQYIRKLLLQEYEVNNLTYTEYWRPRFSKFAEVILKNILGGTNPENWKDNISLYAVKLIQDCYASNPYPVDEIKTLLKALFIDRRNINSYDSEDGNEKFSGILRDILDVDQRKKVLETLVNCYPNEYHFLGHLGRFIYETAENLQEYDEAEEYINKAFDLGADKDSNLQHIAGMCKRKQIKFYKNNWQKEEFKDIDILSIIEELVEEGNEYFTESREIDKFNLHAYVAQIQMLIEAVGLAKTISGISKNEDFIIHPDYKFYAKLLTDILYLIDEGKIQIEQLETLNGTTTNTTKTNEYLKSTEGSALGLFGDYTSAIDTFKHLSESADRNIRPYFRTIYIYSILLKKTKGDKKAINSVWKDLTENEINLIESNLNSNIIQDPNSIQSLRLWVKLVRYSNKKVSLEDIIGKLKIWYNNADSHVSKLESAYYLYVINSLIAINTGQSFSSRNVKEALEFLECCKEYSQNDKYDFEYLGSGNDINALIHYTNKNESSLLKNVEGTITNIYSTRNGKIRLECGLEAYFSPYVSGFVQGRDETTKVVFNVGFRHSGLRAWNVRRKDDTSQQAEMVIFEEEENIIPEIEPIEVVEEKPELQQTEIFRPTDTKLSGIKMVGYVDVSGYKRKNKNE